MSEAMAQLYRPDRGFEPTEQAKILKEQPQRFPKQRKLLIGTAAKFAMAQSSASGSRNKFSYAARHYPGSDARLKLRQP